MVFTPPVRQILKGRRNISLGFQIKVAKLEPENGISENSVKHILAI